MKKILKSLFAIALSVWAVGCSTDNTDYGKYTPSPEDASEAFFMQSSMSKSFNASTSGSQTIYVSIYRQSNEGELAVGLNRSVPDETREFITIPESVTFAAGEYQAEIPVLISNIENFLKGVTYTAAINLGDYHEFEDIPELARTKQMPDKDKAKTRTDLGTTYQSIVISLSLELDWENMYVLNDWHDLLKEEYEDSDYKLDEEGNRIPLSTLYYYTFWWEGIDDEVTVQRAKGTSVFRMNNWGLGVSIIFTVDPEKKVTVDGKQYPLVIVTEQETGDEYPGYGAVLLANAPLSRWADREGFTYDDYPTYWDADEGTFVFNFHYYLGTTYFTAPITEEYLVLLSGDDDDEEEELYPAVAIEYLGAERTDTGTTSHSLSFTPNGDAAYYYATVIELDPEIEAQANYYTNLFLQQNGFAPYTDGWYNYFDEFYEQYIEMIADDLKEELEQMREDVVSGEYTDYPVIRRTAASTDAWNLGTDAGTLTAVAFSYDASGEFTGVDFKVFNYNPDGDADLVSYDLYVDVVDVEYLGYFTDNSVYVFLQAYNDNITSVTYALVTAEEAEELSTDEEVLAYLAQKGTSLSASALADVNNASYASGGYELFLPAKPATAYKFISLISNNDAQKLEITDVETEETPEYEGMYVQPFVTTQLSYLSHVHLLGLFYADRIADGAYLMARVTTDDSGNKTTAAAIASVLKINADGTVSLADGATEEDLYKLLEANGTAFNKTASTSGDLYRMNYGSNAQKAISVGPNAEIMVIGMAVHSDGNKSWHAAIGKTQHAPSVAFTQTAEANGKNIDFNWKATPTNNVSYVNKVDYALVPMSELTAAGVDTSMLSDEMLNDFAARTTDNNSTEIAAQKANAAKVESILAAKGKSLEGDAIETVNSGSGMSKRFANNAAGQYALIAKAYDTYNTKLTIAQVTVQ
ncbi:MAG: hypothetical protein J1D86_01880 [Alistipes sp.]|nr:hypothetical protein [Alistipes sp.]